MKDVTQEQRWEIMIAQAERFAQADQLGDAVARLRTVVEQMRARTTPENGTSSPVGRLLRRAERQLGAWEKEYADKHREVARHRWAKVESVDDEFARPLPKPPPPSR